MSYMLLIVEPTGQRHTRSPDEGRDVYQRMLDYAAKLEKKGVLRAVNSLREASVRLEVRAGRPRVTDGPFTEAKEFVGGFFLVDCGSREEALELARECPAAEWASIEVRETGPCYE
jgi:hypothetical protein